jgi:Tfp pilus assembly protein PilN
VRGCGLGLEAITMIEINLLPEAQRIRPSSNKQGAAVDPALLAKAALLVFITLLFVNICLAAALFVKNLQFTGLNSKWEKLGPQRKIVDDFNNENSVLTQEGRVIESLIQQRINWPEKLNILSFKLPSGIWFTRLSVSQKEFTLLASVISLQKQEMNLIKKFMDTLQSESSFTKNIEKLQLNSVEKNIIGGYEVANFTISGLIK